MNQNFCLSIAFEMLMSLMLVSLERCVIDRLLYIETTRIKRMKKESTGKNKKRINLKEKETEKQENVKWHREV